MSFYKDEKWLYHQYIELGKSYDTIASEFNIGKTTVARYIKKYGITPKESVHFRGKYKDREQAVEISCKQCGNNVKKKPAHVKRGGNYAKFCSPSCATKWQYANTDFGEKAITAYKQLLATPEGKLAHQERSMKGYLAASSGKRTSIEIKMAEELTARGIEYIEQYNLGDKFALDFFIPEYNIVIECDGDYWHTRPEAIRRDKRKNAYVKACGFSMYRFWEREINADVEACVDVVMAEINDKEAV